MQCGRYLMRKFAGKNTAAIFSAWVILIDTILCHTVTQTIHHVRHFEPVNIDNLQAQHHISRRSADTPVSFSFRALGRSFSTRLKRDVSTLHPGLIVETDTQTFPYDVSRTYTGHIEGEPSRVHGIITKEGYFEGTIHTVNDTYFIERARHHFPEVHDLDFHTLIYARSDVTFKPSNSSCPIWKIREKQRAYAKKAYDKIETDEAVVGGESEKEHLNQWKYSYSYGNISHQKAGTLHLNKETERTNRHKRAVDPTKTVCELYMQADHLYYQKYGGDVNTVIEKLTQHVQAVKDIYKRIDFDGSGSSDNIAFIVKKIKIYENPNAAGYKYNSNVTVDSFLELHSEHNYDAFCLSYLFTYRDFSDGVLGLAWVGDVNDAGGVCEKYTTYQGGISKSSNTGIVTILNYGTTVPSAVSHATFAHEIGHNFGSNHDPYNDKNCSPGGDAGNYIMFTSANSGLQQNNNKLSSCSVASIEPVLAIKARGTDGCFVASTDAICGNRVVEGNEECDCGWEEECTEGCCNPQVLDPTAPGVETPCTRESSAVCSPSEGQCCKTNCQFDSVSTPCRAADSCSNQAFCDGTNSSCPASTNKANTLQCGDSNNFLVCYNGECSDSVCLAHGRTPCHCTTEGNFCHICCKDGNGTCRSSYELADIPDSKVMPGTPCDDYNGYCDATKSCKKVNPSGPLANLKKLLISGEAFDQMKAYLAEHWYIGLAGGLGVIIIMGLVLQFCSKSYALPEDKFAGDVTEPYGKSALPRHNRVTPNTWM